MCRPSVTSLTFQLQEEQTETEQEAERNSECESTSSSHASDNGSGSLPMKRYKFDRAFFRLAGHQRLKLLRMKVTPLQSISLSLLLHFVDVGKQLVSTFS